MTKFEDKTRRFFDDFYKGGIKKNSLGESHSLKLLNDFCSKIHYFFDIKNFLSKQIVIQDPNTKVLDLGCGEGKHLIYLVKEKLKGYFFGIDASAVAIEKAKKRAKKEVEEIKECSKNYKLRFFTQNAKKLNFDNEFFDYVYIVMLLHHVDDYRQVIFEAKRVLKKNGKLLIVDLRGDNFIFGLIRKLLKFFPKRPLEDLFEGDLIVNGKFPQRSNISTKDMRSLLLKSGFLIDDEEYYYFIFQYLYYFYRLFPFLFKPFLSINLLLVRLENRIKNIFKYSYDMYVFVCVKK